MNNMPTTRTNKKVLSEDLVALSQRELDNLIKQAIVLRARRRAPSVTRDEAELMLEINRGLSTEKQKRFDELAEKLETGTMNADQQREFLRLTDFIEKQDAARLKLIGRLAEIRQQTFDVVMKSLGI